MTKVYDDDYLMKVTLDQTREQFEDYLFYSDFDMEDEDHPTTKPKTVTTPEFRQVCFQYSDEYGVSNPFNPLRYWDVTTVYECLKHYYEIVSYEDVFKEMNLKNKTKRTIKNCFIKYLRNHPNSCIEFPFSYEFYGWLVVDTKTYLHTITWTDDDGTLISGFDYILDIGIDNILDPDFSTFEEDYENYEDED